MTNESTIAPELLDQLLSNYAKPEDLLGEEGLFKQLKKALIERALGAELTEHLGYEKGDPAGRGSGNNRNGISSKTVLTEDGEIEIAVPRDRAGTFEPQLIPKGQTRFEGFDDRILSLYARGMTVREIQGHLAELYRIDVSPDLISRVTDAVLDEVREWQSQQHETDLIGDGGTTGCAIGSQLRLVQLDQVLGLSTRAIDTVVEPFGRTVIKIGDDEADVEAEPRRLDTSNGASFAIPGFGSMPRLGVTPHAIFVVERA